MSSETSGQRRVSEAAEEASDESRLVRDAVLNSPFLQGIADIVTQIQAQPFTITDELVNTLRAQTAGTANQAANTFVDEARTRATGPSGAGVRSGSTQGQIFEIGSRLGEALAQADRQTQILQAERRIPDLLTAIGALQTPLGIEDAARQGVTNALLGQGQLLSSVANIPSPASQVGGALGALPFAALGAAGAAGGFPALLGLGGSGGGGGGK